MKLQSITTDKCPHCGCATVVSESAKVQSYDPLETRRFECGFQVEFNYKSVGDEVSTYPDCEKNPATIEFNSKRKIAKGKLKNYVNRLDVDDNFKEEIIRVSSSSLI